MKSILGTFSTVILFVYLFDRAWKTITIWHFFYHHTSPSQIPWPSISLLQPLTASPNDLESVLAIRAAQPYPGIIQHILIVDELDVNTQSLCNKLITQYPDWNPEIIQVTSAHGIATKPNKLLAGLKFAKKEILCFIDDDILLRNDTLSILVSNLTPGIGSTFGLACYSNWKNIWSSLMSAFVNANALLNYIPQSYLLDPFSITGHIYAIKRVDFDAIGGFEKMESRLDDDHELARRIIQAGLKNKQTRAIYDVDNYLPTAQSYLDQMKRWFIFPREMMLPGISIFSNLITLATSLPALIPGILLILTPINLLSLSYFSITILISSIIYFLTTKLYLHTSSSTWKYALLVFVTSIIPFQILFFLFSDNSITWRGQKFLIKRGGKYEINPK